jgi:hypothetical protein
MVLSLSWEVSSHSAAQEVACFLSTLKVYYRVHESSAPLESMLSQRRSFKEIVEIQGPFFLWRELLDSLPTVKLEDCRLSAVRDCLISIFTAAFQVGRPSIAPAIWRLATSLQEGPHLEALLNSPNPVHHWLASFQRVGDNFVRLHKHLAFDCQ